VSLSDSVLKLTVGGNDYFIETKSVRRKMINKLIKVSKRLSRANQNGSNVPKTILVDTKNVEDTYVIKGFISSQTVGTYKSALTIAGELITNCKKYPTPITMTYRTVAYSVGIDSMDYDDSSVRAQHYRDVNRSAVSGTTSPDRVEFNLSVTVGEAH
jgi:hypothetical protein